MTVEQLTQNLEGFLDFMKDRGYPLYHRSNIFLRDFQYAVRDYIRSTTKKDIGTRKSDAYAKAVIDYMETKGLMKKFANNAWTLEMEKYLLEPKVEEEKQEEPA
jgi:hypothetical protein